jgi:ubiquinone/menaquinone biosynthesis C-methylase UbiE
MNMKASSLIYSNLERYHNFALVLDEPLVTMCLQMFERYLQCLPDSILDVSCSTGRQLNALSRVCQDCIGVDERSLMVNYAQFKYPKLKFTVGDPRSFRLQRNFQAILSLRWALSYALTDEDIGKTLDTFAAHAQPGTLLILELLNAAGYIPERTLKQHRELKTPKAMVEYTLQRKQNFLEHKRIWQVPGQTVTEDYCKYRLFSPAEVKHLLAAKGFQVVGMFDNPALEESNLCGSELCVAAIFQGQPSIPSVA